MENTVQRENQEGKEVAIGALFPDLAPITQRFDRLAEVGKDVRTAMLILAGALVLHTIVLIATRSRD
jgi:hypothetical protein